MALSITDPLPELWEQFLSEFPTEKHCREELYQRVSLQRLVRCHHCRGKLAEREFGSRLATCNQCNRTLSLTAGTFFHHFRSARAWLGAIWILEHGMMISSSRFQKLAGVAYSTAWNIFKKLATIIQSEMEGNALYAHSALYSPVICKRSRETPARMHPQSEDVGLDLTSSDLHGSVPRPAETENWLECQDDLAMVSTSLPPEQQTVYALLEDGPIHFDVLCQLSGLAAGRLSSTLMLLELDGQISRQSGDWYRRTTTNRLAPLKAATGPFGTGISDLAARFVDFVKRRFQGISRKYLQNYLALFWCHSDRSRWSPGKLLEACASSGPVRYRDTLNYVTPAITLICPDKSALPIPLGDSNRN